MNYFYNKIIIKIILFYFIFKFKFFAVNQLISKYFTLDENLNYNLIEFNFKYMDFEKLFEVLPKEPIKWNTYDIGIWLNFIGLSNLNDKFSN